MSATETETLTIKVNAVNYTAYATFLYDGCSFETSTTNRQGSGTFTFRAYTTAHKTALNSIAVGQTVAVTNAGATVRFAGVVSELRRKPQIGTQVMIYVINCEGSTGSDPTLESTMITTWHVFAIQTDKSIIQHLFGDYAPTYDVSTFVDNIATITYDEFKNCSLATMMTRICEATGGEWYVDSLKKIHYFDPAGGAAAPYDITDLGGANDARYQDIEYIVDADGNIIIETSTLVPGFAPGQQVTLKNTDLALNGSYYIQRVSAKNYANLPGWVFSYRLTLGTTLHKDVIDHFLDLAAEKTDYTHAHGGDYDGTNIPIANVTPLPAEASALHNAVTLATDADTLLGLSTQQLTLDTQTANYVFAGPTSGAAADPTFRALVAADIPGGVHAAVTIDANLAANLLGLSTQQLTLDLQSRNLVFCSADGADGQAPTFRSLVGEDLPSIANHPTHDHTGGVAYATWQTGQGGADNHTHSYYGADYITVGTGAVMTHSYA